jgi:hypothetical protein
VVCAKSSDCTVLQQPPAFYRLTIPSTQVKTAWATTHVHALLCITVQPSATSKPLICMLGSAVCLHCCVIIRDVVHVLTAEVVLGCFACSTLQARQRSQQQWHNCHLRQGLQLCAAPPQPLQRGHVRARQQLWQIPGVRLATASCVRGASWNH